MDLKLQYGVVLVPSVSHALRAEKLVQAAGIACKLIPTPRQLSSDCGTALRFEWAVREAVRETIEAAGLDHDGLYLLE
jgi:hypothetical protein